MFKLGNITYSKMVHNTENPQFNALIARKLVSGNVNCPLNCTFYDSNAALGHNIL